MQQILKSEFSFVTPAFLGGAEQRAELRAPAFKSLLRYWWRIAVAKECGYNVETIRGKEGQIFGSVFNQTLRSKVTISVTEVEQLKLETESTKNWVRTIDPNDRRSGDVVSYLGYGAYVGPGKFADGRSAFTPREGGTRAVVQGTARIEIRDRGLNSEQLGELNRALILLANFGSVGNKSRNGFGSFYLADKTCEELYRDKGSAIKLASRSYLETVNWPSSIALDENNKPCIWATESDSNWLGIMREYAKIKKNLYQFAKNRDRQPNGKAGRDMLGTHSPRFPSQLHFVVHPTSPDVSEYRGTLIHIPVSKNEKISQNEVSFWRDIYARLDRYQLEDSKIKLTREGV